MSTVEKFDEQGNHSKALDLLFDLIKVVEKEAFETKTYPTPAYSAYAADLLARQSEFQSAIAVLIRYENVAMEVAGTVVPRIAALRRVIQREIELGPLPEEDHHCPSCGVLMDPPPKRSGKCKNCCKRVLARKFDGITVLRTEEQHDEFNQLQEIEEKNEKIFVRANKLGIPDSELHRYAKEFRDQNGFTPSLSDVFWALALEKKSQISGNSERFHNLAVIERSMSEHLSDENRNWLDLAEKAVKHEWLHLQLIEQSEIRVTIVGCPCNQCLMPDCVTTIDVALERPAIPHADCEMPPCPCYYQQARQ
jgi:hypothetical protein